ncbi:hypothetical protein COLO4_08089 [Corchorus olitorius]|uniref:Uncharacterized protein n=1 Tax=Corchorus olitorius TaxID=93759 RepID=A0A1R3KHG6_9ROSI|nr:hypothetical protein COLO4_08089 [Corchorus olitorius]
MNDFVFLANVCVQIKNYNLKRYIRHNWCNYACSVLVLIQSCFYSIILVSCVYDLCFSCTIVRVMDALVNPERPVAVRVNWTVEEEGTLLDCVSVLNVNQFLSGTDRLEQLFNQRCPGKILGGLLYQGN